MKRIKTKYPSVFYIQGKDNEKIFYIRYYRGRKRIEEKAGYQSRGMSAASANIIRTQRIQGKELSNQEQRDHEDIEKSRLNSIWTFSRLWNEYLGTHQTKTIDICKSRFAKHITPVLGDKEPCEISQIDIARFKKSLNEKELKPGSVNKVLELLRRVTNFGINNHLIEKPIYEVKLEKVNDEKTEFLTDEEFQRLWDAIESDSNGDAANIMKMVIFTGMRRGELFKLEKGHIDWQNKFIEIVDPKGNSNTKIPMNEMAESVLTEQNSKHSISRYFFPGKDGKERVNIKRGVNRIRERANLPKGFRPLHGLRHHFATMLANSGEVDLYTLQKMLNHKEPKMTQRYAHIVDKSLKRSADVNMKVIKKSLSKAIEKDRCS
jgi:integrase